MKENLPKIGLGDKQSETNQRPKEITGLDNK
jgi:hypothetical protein